MPVLAAMGEREAGRVREAAGRAVDDLGDHGQRAHRPGADAGHQQQLGEIGRPAFGGGGQRAVQAPQSSTSLGRTS